MSRFEVLLRMPDPDGRPGVYGGTVSAPGPSDPATAAAIIARSDARDARPVDEVRVEVLQRAGGDAESRVSHAGSSQDPPAHSVRQMGRQVGRRMGRRDALWAPRFRDRDEGSRPWDLQ